MSKFTGLIGAKRVSNQAVQSRLYWGFKPYSRLQQAVQDLGVDRPRKLELLALLPCRERPIFYLLAMPKEAVGGSAEGPVLVATISGGAAGHF